MSSALVNAAERRALKFRPRIGVHPQAPNPDFGSSGVERPIADDEEQESDVEEEEDATAGFFSTSISTGVDSSSSFSSILVMSLSIGLVGTTDGAGVGAEEEEEDEEEACGCEGDAIEGVGVSETAPFLRRDDLLVDILVWFVLFVCFVVLVFALADCLTALCFGFVMIGLKTMC